MLRQCHFVHGDVHTVGYIEEDKRIKVGSQVRLKNEFDEDASRWWTVTSMSDARVERSFLKRGFHAGGL